MRKIKVTGAFVQLFSGRVRLTARQAADRADNLKQIEDDLFEIIKPVGVKHGEVFEFDGEILKGQLEDVEEARDEEPGKKAGKKAGKKDDDA